MPAIVRGNVNSEDKERSILEIPAGIYNLAIVFQEPSKVMLRPGESQDVVRWRLSAEATIELQKKDALGKRETYQATFATITLPAPHHEQQPVALWCWPLSSGHQIGRVVGLKFRWESDAKRAKAAVMVLATTSTTAPACGLFALPFPGRSDVLQPFGP
jgi:hypothetical protein